MSVMRVEKNSNYTVMANYHLRDNQLSLKAKGLLSVMLSLPAEWDYTLNGLSRISKEGISAIRAAILELEDGGYVRRARIRNEVGQLTDVEYTIYELPQNNSEDHAITNVVSDPPLCELPVLEKPMFENQMLDDPMLELPTLENHTQINTKEKKKDRNQSNASNPNQSYIHPSIIDSDESEKSTSQSNLGEKILFNSTNKLRNKSVLSPCHGKPEAQTEQQMYLSEPSLIAGMRRKLSYQELVQKIKDQIEYWNLIEENNKDEIDNIVSIMVEVISTKCEFFTISGKKYPADLVHQRYKQINYITIQYVLECMHKCGSDIRNIKQYLIATLFNAPATCDSYYGAAVRRDFEFLRG